jgi:segregation and condensation protein A
VRQQNVAIEKIAMAPIVSRFLEYVRTASERSLNLDIEWLHMAATLIHWKSRSLLPLEANGEPAADPIRDSLVQQLLAHRKEAAEDLSRRRALEQTRCSRSRPDELREVPESEAREGFPLGCVWDMIQTARELARWVENHREEGRPKEQFCVEPDDVTVAGMINYLRMHLSTSDECKLDGAALLLDQATVSRRSCLFLGMLEMAREGELEMAQNEVFGPIWLTAGSLDSAKKSIREG